MEGKIAFLPGEVSWTYGTLTEKRITENNIANANNQENRILEKILSSDNLNIAYKQVKRNKVAHGVDGMEVENLLQYLKDNGNKLRETIQKGKYNPRQVRRVEIPKDNGKRSRQDTKCLRDLDLITIMLKVFVYKERQLAYSQ